MKRRILLGLNGVDETLLNDPTPFLLKAHGCPEKTFDVLI